MVGLEGALVRAGVVAFLVAIGLFVIIMWERRQNKKEIDAKKKAKTELIQAVKDAVKEGIKEAIGNKEIGGQGGNKTDTQKRL